MTRDELLQREFPTVMVPVYGELPPCEENRTRLLMGKQGLFIETNRPWARLIKLLWASPRPLPYGDVAEVEQFEDVLMNGEVRQLILEECIPRAKENAEKNLEWAGWIVWSREAGFRYHPLKGEASAARVKFVTPELPRGTQLVVDVHSHGRMSPFFSSEDNDDDMGGVRICVVLGDFGSTKDLPCHYVYRYSVEGFFLCEGGEVS